MEKQKEKLYCDYKCKYVKFQKHHPVCGTFDIVYCKKYSLERNKGSLCLDYNEKFLKLWKKNK